MQHLPIKNKKKFKLITNMQTHEYLTSSVDITFIKSVYKNGESIKILVHSVELD